MEQLRLEQCKGCISRTNVDASLHIRRGENLLLQEAADHGIPQEAMNEAVNMANAIATCEGINDFCPRFSALCRAVIWMKAQNRQG